MERVSAFDSILNFANVAVANHVVDVGLACFDLVVTNPSFRGKNERFFFVFSEKLDLLCT